MISLGLIPLPILRGTVIEYEFTEESYKPWRLGELEEAGKHAPCAFRCFYDGPQDTPRRRLLWKRDLHLGTKLYVWRKALDRMSPRIMAASASVWMEHTGYAPSSITEIPGGLKLTFMEGDMSFVANGHYGEPVTAEDAFGLAPSYQYQQDGKVWRLKETPDEPTKKSYL